MLTNDAWEKAKQFKVQQKATEFMTLLRIMEGLNVAEVLEIGTNTGGTARAFLEIGCDVTSIDKEVFKEHTALIQDFGTAIKLVTGDSTSPIVIQHVHEIYLADKVDMLYIDGWHDQKVSTLDYANYKDLVKEDGLIVFHDIVNSPLHRQQQCEVWKTWAKAKKGKRWLELVGEDDRWGGLGVLFL